MAHTKRFDPASQSRWYGSALLAVALATAASLGGCASASDVGGGFPTEASETAPYQVAGPVVAKTPAHTQYQSCSGGVSGFVDDCSGFGRYYGP